MRTLITILFISFTFLGWSQIKFYKLFTNNGADFGQGIVQLEDSSYMITGASSSFWGGGTQAFLLKIDSLGNKKWSQSYGGPETDWGRRVLYKKNVGFFICGYTNSYGNGGYDHYLIKTDESGNFEWDKTYGSYGWERVHDAALTRDTGVIMVGETSSNPTDNRDINIIRTDINGDTIWTKTIGGPGDDYLTSIRRYQDSLYVVGGSVWLEDSSLNKGYMAFFHENGTMIWSDTLGDYGDYWINDIEVNGTNFVGSGGTSGVGKDGVNTWFCRNTDVGINEIDFENPPLGSMGGEGDNEYYCVATYGDLNHLYMAEYFDNSNSFEGGSDFYLQEFDGGLLWNTGFTIAHVNPEIPSDLIRTSDGGAIIVGYTTNVISGGNEILVVKVGPNIDFPDFIPGSQVEPFVSVESIHQLNDITIYPNPASSIIHIKIQNPDMVESAILFNNEGQIVCTSDVKYSINDLNVSELPNGLYFIELSGQEIMPVRQKVMIQH